MSDSNCIICFEALSSALLGSTACGHCFHRECWQSWVNACSRGGRSSAGVSCPMCNAKTKTFTNLFLNLQEPESDDDDDSLSSASSSEQDNANEQLSPPQEPDSSPLVNAPEVGIGEPDEQQVASQNESNSNESNNVPDVIEIDINDDNSVVEITSPPPLPPRSNKKKKRQSNSNNSSGDNASRIRKKAKRLKKQNKFLESQREEFVERERKLLEDFGNTRERLEKLEKEQEARENQEKAMQRDLEGYRVQNARLTRERDTATRELERMKVKASKAVADLEEVMRNSRQDVENAHAKAMREVQLITEQQPKLIQKNYELNECLVKKNQEVKRLIEERDSLRDCVQKRADQQVVSQRVNGKKQAKNVARAYQRAKEEQEQEEAEEARARKQARAAAPASRPLKHYSAQAARISVGGLKVKAKKCSVMDALGPSREKQVKRSGSTDRDESLVLGGMSINVSSNKRRKVEPFPPRQAGTHGVATKKATTSTGIKAKMAPRKEKSMHDFFQQKTSR